MLPIQKYDYIKSYHSISMTKRLILLNSLKGCDGIKNIPCAGVCSYRINQNMKESEQK